MVLSQNTRAFDPKLNWDSDTDNLIEGGKRKIDSNLLLKICQELKIEV